MERQQAKTVGKQGEAKTRAKVVGPAKERTVVFSLEGEIAAVDRDAVDAGKQFSVNALESERTEDNQNDIGIGCVDSVMPEKAGFLYRMQTTVFGGRGAKG